jgi:hypothetical protein
VSFYNQKITFIQCGIILFPLLILTCSPSFNGTENTGQNSPYWDSLPDVQAYPDAGAFIVLDEATVEVTQQDVMTFSEISRHTVIKVFNEKGYRYANVVIPYDGDSKVSGIQARTILPSGRSVHLSKDQIFETDLFTDFIFYSDLRAKRFTMPAVEPGCVLEYRWTKTTRNFTFWTRWAFQQDDPVGTSKITIRCPNTWDIRWKTYGTDIQPRIENAGGGSKADHVWKLENIPAFQAEAGMPHGTDRTVSILFAPVGVKTWDDISCWFRDVSQNRFKPDASVLKRTREVLGDAREPREKLRRIFEFVRDRIRYVAIEIGIGGYQAHPAAKVLQNRYGDCKDMVALISAMSQSAGISVDPVLVPTWHYGEMDSGLVSLIHFNHLIGRAVLPDSSVVWMDATDKSCRFGGLPWYDQDRLVLVVAHDGGARILRTPKSSAFENTIKRAWNVEVDSAGKARGTLTMDFNGAPAAEMRTATRWFSRNDLKNWFGREMLSRFPSGNWEQVEVVDRDSLERPLRITGIFSEARFFYSNANGYGFQPGSLSFLDWNRLFPEKNRMHPLQMEFPVSLTDEATIDFPDNWRTIRNAENDSLESFFGKFTASWSSRGNRLSTRRCFRFDSTRIEPSGYARFQSMLNRMGEIDKKTVVFTR